VVSRRTLIVSALSAAAVLLVTGTLLTQAAARASGQISASASSPTTSVGQLSISFTAGTAITSFTVHILTASGTDVLDLPEADFTMTSSSTGTDTASSTWTLSQAITTSQLLLGTYAITVDAADAGGDTVAGQAAGTLDYLIQPTVTLTASPAVLGYASPSTTLSGTVTGQWPDGSNSPLAGQAVLITNSQGPSPPASLAARSLPPARRLWLSRR
jgi:archaellin